MNLDQMAQLVMNEFGDATLADLRAEAQRETTGIKFRSLRVAGGQRLFLVACLTQPLHVVGFETVLGLDYGARSSRDWGSLSLLSLFRDYVGVSDLGFEVQRDHLEQPVALALIASHPSSMQTLSSILSLPA